MEGEERRRRGTGTDGGGSERECGEVRKELLRTSVEVVQSALIERARRIVNSGREGGGGGGGVGG
jgi:hypothetical protein